MLFVIFIITLPILFILSIFFAIANAESPFSVFSDLRKEFGVDDIPKLMEECIDYIKGKYK